MLLAVQVADSQAKGTNFSGTLQSLKEIRGQNAVDVAVDNLRGPLRDQVRLRQLVPVGWYSAADFGELLRAIDATTGGGVQLIRDLARATTERDFTGLHRMVVRLLSPSTVAQHSHRLLQLYFRGGSIDVDSKPHVVTIRFRGWHGFTPLLWEDLAASSEAILHVVGAKNSRGKVASLSMSNADAALELRYD